MRVDAIIPSTSAGATLVDDAVVAKVAGLAAREVSGAFPSGGNESGCGDDWGAVTDADLARGVSVNVDRALAAVAITVVADHPQVLGRIDDEMRSAIVSAVESIVGLTVSTVHITYGDDHETSHRAGTVATS